MEYNKLETMLTKLKSNRENDPNVTEQVESILRNAVSTNDYPNKSGK